MARIADIDVARLTARQKEVYDAIAESRGQVGGPLRVWLNSPELAARAQELGAFCRYHSSLPPKLSEVAILVMGAHWKAKYEWNSHAPIAAKAGVPADVIEAIRTGRRPTFADPQQAAVYDFATELLEKRQVSQETYDRARRTLGELALVDLTGILGYYTLISMTCVAFDVEPGGEEDPFR
ncbi:MAG: hypothetical protein RLZ98_1443 [Pseudomonadota bacterium]|jgi:4-carboxymuconolactone decarboxylase